MVVFGLGGCILVNHQIVLKYKERLSGEYGLGKTKGKF